MCSYSLCCISTGVLPQAAPIFGWMHALPPCAVAVYFEIICRHSWTAMLTRTAHIVTLVMHVGWHVIGITGQLVSNDVDFNGVVLTTALSSWRKFKYSMTIETFEAFAPPMITKMCACDLKCGSASKLTSCTIVTLRVVADAFMVLPPEQWPLVTLDFGPVYCLHNCHNLITN